MTLSMYALIFAGICYGFWLHYLIYSAYQAAVDAERKIPLAARLLIAPALVAAVVIDIVFNSVFGWMLFGEKPFAGYKLKSIPSWTLTYRCGRYLTDLSWRGVIARWLCKNLLDPFQSGGHCRQI